MVPTGDVLVVAAPPAYGGYGYEVYVSTARNTEVLQTTSGPQAFSSSWTAPDTIATTGFSPLLNGAGDGNLTRVATHVDASAADDRVTEMLYDNQDRLIAQKEGVQASENDGAHRLITYYSLDNLGEVGRHLHLPPRMAST